MYDIVQNIETHIPFQALNRQSGSPETGALISIKRCSDDKWWNGTTEEWVDDIAYNAMTHITEGAHEYLMTFTSSGDYFLIFTQAATTMINDAYIITVYPETRLIEDDVIAALRGSGATSGTVTIRDDDSTPVADANVWVTSDVLGANLVAGSLVSNSSGQVTFYLDSGLTYYVWGQKDGVNFSNPYTIVW